MRDPWLDNVKYVLVTFVVMGHALPLAHLDTTLDAQLYDFIYSWHIPAFVLITGYFSRGFRWSRRHLSALVTGLLIPYLIFESVMRQANIHWSDQQVQGPYLLNPGWPMWYLVATMLWRLASPVLRKHWLMLPASIVASLGFGMIDADWTDWFDLSRVVGLLPFFVFGLLVKPEHLALLKRPWAPAVGVVVLLLTWTLAGRTDDWISTRWLWYAFPYSMLRADGVQVDNLTGAMLRLGVMAVGFVAALAVLSLVPRKQHWFTPLGAATLVVYLFHGFVIRVAWALDFPQWAQSQGGWVLALVLLAAIGVSTVLAAPPIASRLSWLIDPVTELRRRRERRTRNAEPPSAASLRG
ncbi:acyltransferase family protein [Nocardioides alcanivorans]|uniref:acyltransferase family protein n=1 Tax=Nocardioides alcanivorans TaxID=2897352 RepID=UPI001F169C57|nr:acyltransferase family protein [Nocardioides alcanivorans]